MTEQAARIRDLLGRSEPESRRQGAQQIGQTRGHEAAVLLRLALGDEDWRVRKEAALVAATLVEREEVVLALVDALDEKENVGLRNAAVEALVAIGSDSVPAAIGALASLDADGRKLAVEILGGVPDPQGTRTLIGALEDPDPNVRCAAAEALGHASAAGEEARAAGQEALMSVLSTDDVLVKLAALASLAQLKAELPWSLLEPLASDAVLRRNALIVAARSREGGAMVALGKAIGDRSSAVSSDALVALVECVVLEGDAERIEAAGAAVRATPGAAQRIRQAASSEDSRLRGAALVGLGLLRDALDVATLADALADDDIAPRAESGLRLFGKDAVAPLLEAGRRSILPVRATTISLVPLLSSTSDAPTMVALHEALVDPSPTVVMAAISTIAATGGAGDLSRVARFATHFDSRIVRTACAALHSLASRHGSEAKALRARLDATGADAIVGCILLGALAGATGGSKKVDAADLQFLQAALANPDAGTRRAAVDALAAIGGDVAREAVTLALTDEESDVTLAAVRALGRMKVAEPLVSLVTSSHDSMLAAAALRALTEASPALACEAARPRVRASDPVLACAAVEAIGSLRGPARDDALFEALEHVIPEVVKTALFELARGTLDPRSIARLGECLAHESWEVRRVAAELLGQEGGDSARLLLRARLERETDVLVRDALGAALASRSSGALGG